MRLTSTGEGDQQDKSTGQNNDQESDYSDLDSLFEKDPEFLKERRAEDLAIQKRLVMKQNIEAQQDRFENATDSENEELLQFANYEDDYDDLSDLGDFSDELNLSRPDRVDLARNLGEFGSLSDEDAVGLDGGSEPDTELTKMMDQLTTSDDDAPVYKTDTEEGQKIEYKKPFDMYTSKNPQDLFEEEDFMRVLEASSASDSDDSGLEKREGGEGSDEKGMEELFGTDEDSAGEEEDYDYDEPSLYDEEDPEEEIDALHQRGFSDRMNKEGGMKGPSRADLESEFVERLTEPSEEMIERENAAAQIPSRLESGEPEIPLSQKYDVEKWGRYLDIPEPAKIEPIHWDDVVEAFKAKGEEVFFFLIY